MQAGSLVECIGEFDTEGQLFQEILPEIGVIYTVRSIEQIEKVIYIQLAEIINETHKYKNKYWEIGFSIGSFRELQPPMDVSALFQDQLKVSNENRVRK